MNRVSRKKTHWPAVSGSITVYMALSLLLVLVLICTVTESGRVNALHAKLKGVVYMGMDSVFSEYALPVFEDYGVMMLWCSDEEFVKRFDAYLANNLEDSATGLPSGASLCRAGHEETVLSETVRAPDENGKLFEEQVYEYMQLHLLEEAAEKILKDADIFRQGKKVNDFMDKVDKHRKVFTKVEESVGKIKEKTEALKKRGSDPASCIGHITDSLEKYEKTREDVFLTDVYVYQNDLIDARYKLADGLDEIGRETQRYHANAEKAKQAIEEMETELYVEQDGMPEEVYRSIQTEIADLKQKAGESKADFYKIEENIGIVEDYKEKVNSLDGLIGSLDTDINEDSVSGILRVAQNYRESFKDFNLEKLTINYDTERTEKESSAFIDEINGIFKKGVLFYVAPEVSAKTVSVAGLPSGSLDKKMKSGDSAAKAALHKAVFSEYIKEHFGDYTGVKEEKALDYEIEYILGGKASDRANLQAVVDKIILIRTGCNMISLFTDAEKKAEAYGLAAAIVGFTGMPVLIKIMQLLIMSVWALAEGIADAKILCEGQKVPTIKKSTEWSLSLTGVKHFSMSGLTGSGNEKGLSYRDYLQVLLLGQNKGEQVLRTLDMIQMNMAKNENPAFQVSDCIMRTQADVSFRATPLFVSLPFVAQYTGSSGMYGFELQQAYSY